MDETDRPDDRRAAGSWVLPNSESRRQRNHEAAKSGIQKRKKTKTYPPLSCKIEYLLTSNHSDGSIASEFFTGDGLVAGCPFVGLKRTSGKSVAMSESDPFETLCLPQRALPAAVEVRGQSVSLRLAAPRVEGHNFDSSSCCRSPIHVLARSASSLLAWSALPRAL